MNSIFLFIDNLQLFLNSGTTTIHPLGLPSTLETQNCFCWERHLRSSPAFSSDVHLTLAFLLWPLLSHICHPGCSHDGKNPNVSQKELDYSRKLYSEYLLPLFTLPKMHYGIPCTDSMALCWEWKPLMTTL